METSHSSQSRRRLGRFELLRPLGEGGMGTVYIARDVTNEERVALKIPQLGTASDSVRPELIRRFHREFAAMQQIRHPNLCRVREAGEEQGEPYLVMDFIPGRALKSVLAEKRLPIPTTVAMIRKLALAMQTAHLLGVIHRDLKPGNIIVTENQEPIIVDFGLARALTEESSSLTQTGAYLGTPAYSAPEQFHDSKSIGPAADQYSLGVILYEMLTGRLPFQAQSYQALMKKILLEPPDPPMSLNPGIPEPLAQVCLTALGKEPEQRFRSMLYFADALEEWQRANAISLGSTKIYDRGSTTVFPPSVVAGTSDKPLTDGDRPQIPELGTTDGTRSDLWWTVAMVVAVSLLLLVTLSLTGVLQPWSIAESAAITRSDAQMIVGTWKMQDTGYLLAFAEDGTMLEQRATGSSKGIYELRPDSTLYTKTEGLLFGHNEATFKYSLSEREMILTIVSPLEMNLQFARISDQPAF